MSVILKGLTIAGLRLTTGNGLPVIKAVVEFSGSNGFDTDAEFYSFNEQIYNKAIGQAVACSFWVNPSKTDLIPQDVQSLATGDHVQGDNTGFSIAYTVRAQNGVVYQVNPLRTYYKGLNQTQPCVSYAQIYSGYSDVAVSYAVIYVTESGNIIKGQASYQNGLLIKYTNLNPGIALIDGQWVVVGYISGEGEILEVGNRPRNLVISDDNISDYIINEFDPDDPDSDPFAPGGTSEPGGGNGTFNGTSDSNPIPGDPTISATDTGFMTVFATNVAGIKSLANSLWTDIFSAIQPGGSLEGTVEALKNIVASPYDAILGCHIVPVNVPTGSSRNVKMYGVLPSSVSLPVASSQWVHKDCGSLTIQPYDGSYLDYAPYSKVTSLYLPFVGVVSVDIDIIMNTTIGVYYKIDIISGQCIVYVTKNNDVYFQYQGQCAVPIPVTSIDWSNTVSAGLGLIGSVTNIVGSAVGGGAMGGPAGALSGAVTGTIGQAGSMAQNVMNSKPDIKAGSGVGGAAALLGCKSPYLIIERPRKSTPKKQNHYTGYPSNIRAKLGDLNGYTEVSRVYVNHMNATTEEKAEIERLLNEGVVL